MDSGGTRRARGGVVLNERPTVSVIISTHDRANSLARTLEGLGGLRYDPFEVVVVNGPSTDGTADLLASWEGRLKVGTCNEANLARSRNIGIALASGDLVAFIDDDAYPDPRWLDDLVDAFADREVAAVGGPVFDHTGHELQARFSTCDRRGFAEIHYGSAAPTRALSSPYSDKFVYPIGTNAVFRRDLLIEVGGFDERFTYYMEETDVARRLLDRGYVIEARDRGFVFHKFLASSRRSDDRVLRDRFVVMRSHAYFVSRHMDPRSTDDVIREAHAFAELQRADVLWHRDRGNLGIEDELRFERDVPRALAAGIAFAQEAPRTRSRAWFDDHPAAFVPFPVRAPQDGHRLHLCFFVEEYPPDPIDGIGRVVHSLATGLAARGHTIRVICPGAEHDRVDLEDGVWVHRVAPSTADPPSDVPPRIWAVADAMRSELDWIDQLERADLVQVPNWNVLGIAALRHDRHPIVLGLYTPIAVVADVDERIRSDDREVDELRRLELECYEHADAFLAASHAVVTSIEERYHVQLAVELVTLVPHGIPDPRETERPLHDGARGPAGSVDVLVVGRLEPRKGTDLLLDCLPDALSRAPNLRVIFAGADRDDAGYGPSFCREHPELTDRVLFLGRVDDNALEHLYASCDAVAMPSRSESFGLTLIEAMAHGKPVLASDLPSSREIVEHGMTGLLVPVVAHTEWADALVALAESADLRAALGQRARERFVASFEREIMVSAAEHFYRCVVDTDADPRTETILDPRVDHA